MSRSIRNRHNKYGVIIKLFGGDSDKKDKIVANRKFRRYSKMHAKLSTLCKDNMFKFNNIRDVSDTWNFRSDGLAHYISFNCPTPYSCNIEPYTKEERNKYKSK